MKALRPHLLIVLDDRELASGEVKSIVGARRFGDITFKRQRLAAHFRAALPAWARPGLLHLCGDGDVPLLREAIEAGGNSVAVLVVSARAGFDSWGHLGQLVERLPYADEDFTDRLYKPLVVFFHQAQGLVQRWPEFARQPLHHSEAAWHNAQRVQSVQPVDLAQIRDFLTFISGATATRHFNEMHGDAFHYTKRSVDVAKMEAEYRFYQLVPEGMRPWLVETFDFQRDQGQASYKMLRYYLADAALQWVHGAFEAGAFDAFVERLMFFICSRPRRGCARAASAAVSEGLFVKKLQHRTQQFLASPEGQRINQLAVSTDAVLDLTALVQRFTGLYQRHAKEFACDYEVIGHGDPCFSNVLYDQRRYLLKLIDPKGAAEESQLWTHPLYDLCKLSHSVLGDYDFINNGLYRVDFNDDNRLELRIEYASTGHALLKQRFVRAVSGAGYRPWVMRLGEASLFLSMLPLHMDYPNKVLAFMLRAASILDEVERE